MRRIAALTFLTLVAASAAFSGELAVGLLLPTQQEERWVRDFHVFRTKAEEYGCRLEVGVVRNNQEMQNERALQLLDKDIDVLIIAPHDAEGAAPAVVAARSVGVPIVCYDRLVLGIQTDAYVSFDNVRVGELQGEWLRDRGPRGNYVVMSGAPTDANSKMLLDGVMGVLQPMADAGEIEIVARQPVIDWQPANAMKIVETVLAKLNGDISAVVAPNDATASAAITALEAMGLAGKVAVTGQDADVRAVRRILEGTQSMTVFKDTRLLGDLALQVALRLARAEDVSEDTDRTVDCGEGEVPAFLLEPVAVDKANAMEVLVESGYMKREDIIGD